MLPLIEAVSERFFNIQCFGRVSKYVCGREKKLYKI